MPKRLKQKRKRPQKSRRGKTRSARLRRKPRRQSARVTFAAPKRRKKKRTMVVRRAPRKRTPERKLRRKVSRKVAVKKRGGGRARPTERPARTTRRAGSSFGRVAFQANRSHEVFNELRALLIKASSASFPEIEKALRKVGKIRLALIAGAFLNVPDARVDLLIVGDNVRAQRLFHFIREQEAELGKELRYVILDRDEFLYRYDMYDRFLRDILDSPHYKIINKLKV